MVQAWVHGADGRGASLTSTVTLATFTHFHTTTVNRQNMNAAHRNRRCDDVPGVAPVGEVITLDQWALQYGWYDRDAEEATTREQCGRHKRHEKGEAQSHAESALKRLQAEHKDHIRTLVEDADLYDENYRRLVLTKAMVQDMLDKCMGSSVSVKRYLEELDSPVVRLVKRPAAFLSQW